MSKKVSIVSWSEWIVLGCLSALLFAFLASVEAFEAAFEYSRKYEDWQLDEVIIMVPVMAIVLSIFSIQRFRQVRKEVGLRLEAERLAFTLATTNPITALPNEHVSIELISADSLKTRDSYAVAAIRCGHWQATQHRYGREVADALACAAISSIRRILPDSAVFGSVDTSTVLVGLADFGHPDQFKQYIQRIEAELSMPVTAVGFAISAPVHIGVVIDSGTLAGGNELVSRALSALVEARHANQGCVVYFNGSAEAARTSRLAMLDELRLAVDVGAVTCMFQPIVNIVTGRTVSCEALARWRRADGTQVPPDVFVELCAEAGLSAALTRVIIRSALAAVSTWPEDMVVSVNISREEMAHPNLVTFINDSLATHGVSARRLEIELTETDKMLDVAATRKNVIALRRMGIKIAIDDFGAGFSNLHVLHDIDFDTIKIDRSFTSGITRSFIDRAIVEATLALARSMKRDVTLEGIEDQATLDLALSMGCTKAQGYFFSRPLDATAVAVYLESESAQNQRKVA